MMRLFCAVKVPLNESVEEAFDVFTSELSSEAINWVNMHQLHITLKFFGDVPAREVNNLVDALHLAASDFPPFSFMLEGCGTFGSYRQPRVIWLGIKKGRPLILLNEKIQHHLSPLGYKPEQRLFSPHLTIGRIKQLKEHLTLNNLESEFKESPFGTVSVTEFYLFRSLLTPRGPQYSVIHTFVLGDGRRA